MRSFKNGIAIHTKKIIGVMASTSEGIIGHNNGLPWNYPEELDHFRALTAGQVIVMGRKTFEHVPPRLFNNRTPIVFSKTHSFEDRGVKTVSSLEDFLSLINTVYNQEKFFMIGGAELAHLFLEANVISEFFLSKIHHPYPGDTRIKLDLLEDWKETAVVSHPHFTISHLHNPRSNT